MNFAEAAMAIQNSLIIFAKNVDSIWARTMSIRLSANINRKQNNDDEDNEDCDVGTGEEGAKQKEKAKKKKKGTFNVEEFQLLPFLNTDKNIDMKLDKKEDKLAKQSGKNPTREVGKNIELMNTCLPEHQSESLWGSKSDSEKRRTNFVFLFNGEEA
ncbi:unnamed protein product [Bemisia tabaci]|uniref:Condensin complex subunit 2 n=1 Tax=Bemisia tabaci TaxID=7038 RepID=A0A9P0AKR8_BEMTA|nr:unnamed protein product [Bemisia tabaci]